MPQKLLHNVADFLLHNTTVFLQNATDITKCNDFIIKCELLQNVTVITKCLGTYMLFTPSIFGISYFLKLNQHS